MAQSNTRRVYVPQDMNVTLPASRENPGGRVVQLKAGYCDLDEACQVHPVLARLQTVDPDEYQRQEKIRKAEEEHAEAVSKADQQLAEVRMEVEKERQESIQKASEDYVARRDRAMQAGEGFVEPHPDPETQRAMALTAPAAQFATTNPMAFALTPTESDRAATQTNRESMPTEAENRALMRGDAPQAHAPRGDAPSDGDKKPQRR